MTSTPARVQQGSPTGGQFAAAQRGEAEVDLGAPTEDQHAVTARADGEVSLDDGIHRATPVTAESVADLPTRGSSELTYTDHVKDNAIRASYGSEAVRAYGATTHMLDEEPETAISDLVGDLRHLCDSLGLDFDELADNGTSHYEAEIRGEL